MPEERRQTSGHQPPDENLRMIVVLTAAVGLLVLLALVLSRCVEDRGGTGGRRPRVSLREGAERAREFPAPRLQASPTGELAEVRRRQEELLGSWQLVDPGKGRARIPVERAMELLLEQGLPVREDPEGRGR